MSDSRQAVMRETYFTSAGLRVRALEAGEGPPVVLVHGLGDCAEVWDRNLGPLAAAGYRAIAVELPGHGLSEKPLDRGIYQPSFIRPFLDGLLEAIGAQRAAFVGSSLGGLVAARYTIERPERVAALVLDGAAGLGRDIAPFLRLVAYLPLWSVHLFRLSQTVLEAALRSIVVQRDAVTPELLEVYYRYRCLPGAAEAFLLIAKAGLTLQGLRPELLVLPRLQHVDVPICIVAGRQDLVVPVHHALQAQAMLPRAQVVIFEACGHWPHREHPERFNATLTAFLAEALKAAPAAS
jgi:2-hydroxy-6-oxonona-2,4-dienedioate hydrolase